MSNIQQPEIMTKFKNYISEKCPIFFNGQSAELSEHFMTDEKDWFGNSIYIHKDSKHKFVCKEFPASVGLVGFIEIDEPGEETILDSEEEVQEAV